MTSVVESEDHNVSQVYTPTATAEERREARDNWECPPTEEDAEAAPTGQKPVRYIGTVYAMMGLDQQSKQWVHNWDAIRDWNTRNIEAEFGRAEPRFDWRIKYPLSGHRYNDQQREEAANQTEGAWLCYLDTDMVFSADVVGRLIHSMRAIEEQDGNCEIVSGLYTNREPTRLPIIYRYAPERDLWTNVLEFPWDRPFRVDGAGGGCLLVKRGLLDAVRRRFGLCFGMLPNYRTEDLCFFKRVYDLGKVPVWCDPRIQAGHAYLTFAMPDDFKALQADAAQKAEADGRLFRCLPDRAFLTVPTAARLTGRTEEELAAAMLNHMVVAKVEGGRKLLELTSLIEWHGRGGA